MFQSANLKLGLDKAVLQSMAVTSTADGPSKNESQFSNTAIHSLLKNGAYALVNENEDEEVGRPDKFCSEDEDERNDSPSHFSELSVADRDALLLILKNCGYGAWDSMEQVTSSPRVRRPLLKAFVLSVVAECRRIASQDLGQLLVSQLRTDVTDVLMQQALSKDFSVFTPLSTPCSPAPRTRTTSAHDRFVDALKKQWDTLDVSRLLRLIEVDPVLQTEYMQDVLKRDGSTILQNMERIFAVRELFRVHQMESQAISAAAAPAQPCFAAEVAICARTVKLTLDWSPQHDVSLLLGVVKHGVNWMKIASDDELLFARQAMAFPSASKLESYFTTLCVPILKEVKVRLFQSDMNKKGIEIHGDILTELDKLALENALQVFFFPASSFSEPSAMHQELWTAVNQSFCSKDATLVKDYLQKCLALAPMIGDNLDEDDDPVHSERR